MNEANLGKSIKRREYLLEGLCCANCAAKIEKNVSNIKDVTTTSLNFMTKKLIVGADSDAALEEIFPKLVKIVNSIEPDVKVIPKSEKIIKSKYKSSIKYDATETKKSNSELLEDINEHQYEECEQCEVKISSNKSSNDENQENRKKIIRLAIGVIPCVIAAIFKFNWYIEFILFAISFLIIGGQVLIKAGKNIYNGQIFDENFLMSIASIGAFGVGQFSEAVAVMLFYEVGEFMQDLAVDKSRKSISSMMNIRPDYANIKSGDKLIKVNPETVEVGSIIVVKPGEKVPLDGIVKEGISTADTSALTGETLPKNVEPGDTVLAGYVNTNGVIEVEVTKTFGESTVSKILDLVENASAKKAVTENFITKFARYYTPFVVFSAIALTVIPTIFTGDFTKWIYRALVFLVISCPCALVISVPLGFFGGIGGASKLGILIKGGNYLEALNDVKMVVFDKTGTLTKGIFKVTSIKNEAGFSKEEVLEVAALAEGLSNHPIAVSIRNAYKKEIDNKRITNYSEITGKGISTIIDGRKVLTGNSKLMEYNNIKYNKAAETGTVVYVAIDGAYAGCIIISDEVKSDSKVAVANMKKAGIRKTVMLTGDMKAVADEVGREIGVDEVYAGLLPQDKVEKIEELRRNLSPKEKLIFVGDGINDAPVLARADIGIAMGGIGSDAAIEAADIVIMTDEPSRIVSAINAAKRTRRIVMQNIIFALGVKVILLILGAFGIANMWEAVFGDVGVALLAILNSMRALKVEKRVESKE
ncbi:heavy metal translocating P-type ATPase [Clostridium oryzae]|uniref:Cadmium, zinc and cobalt-transporting ATPase n=1 Tax=Clostridium oryzae TaxID=1450648 RepID=A0A1V4IY97_9CLOT|nr:heavy metal translocating P-type ATPase [Clostridium oryzae]OPJ65021.1 cadmium, zinc and cobalt-transporting ATPase [Clostridium oryzae]